MNYEQLPLSYAQQRLWFLDQLESNSGFYNIPLALRLEGKLKVKALEKSLGAIINRHEALRTNFITVEGQPVQIIHPEKDWKLTIVKEQELINSGEEKSLDEWIQNKSFQPFDLANDPLIRGTLVEVSETEYRLLICLHHIVADGWSIEVFVRELTTLYSAYAQGLESTLRELPIQYGDFALWQRDWLQGDVLQNQLNYWQEQLADAPALLSLPADRPRPSEQRFIGTRQRFVLSSELSAGINKLSRQQGTTLFMTLLAAFKVLLYRYTGQTDIVVGTPTANRNRSELEGLIGFFVNTLVLRTDLEGNPSFNELLNQVQEKALEAYSYEDLPFEMLVEALQPERNLSHTPLFQVMFGLENETLSSIELEGVKVTHQALDNNTAKFDLTLAIKQSESGLSGVWEYNTDLFDHSTIERLSAHFVKLLEGIVANPEQPISQLPLLTETEEQEILVDWNQTQVDYSGDFCLHQLFEQQVERNPEAIAVRFENESLTYGELNQRANQLAHHLQSLGVKADHLVGILVERSLEMIVGIFGILKAGAAYVPLDVKYPQERLAYIFDDTKLNILLTQEQLLKQLPEYEGTTLCLDRDWATIATQDTVNPMAEIAPHNLAYVIYTSGSTGKPKGVMIEHHSATNFIKTAIQEHSLAPEDSILQFASICFDASIEEIFGGLLSGATLVLRTEEMLRSSEDFWQCCQVWQLSHLNIATAYWHQLVAELKASDLQIISQIKVIVLGGEAVQPSKVKQWHQITANHSPLPQLLNTYGPTETTVAATLYDFTSPTITNVPIGSPLSNTQTYILDSFLQPVPVGVPGELHIGGTGLARGYLNRPELTQEKFISNPFSSDSDSRLYKTGDLVRYLPALTLKRTPSDKDTATHNGNIEYLGRIDNQVKVRGFRIELGEIETILSQHPRVKMVIVNLYEDIAENKSLVAYIVPTGESKPTKPELRQYLKSKVPEYMVPSFFILLSALPITVNGKVDRRALPAPDLAQDKSREIVAPKNPLEEMLVQSWEQILNQKNIGVKDNFFEVGGHSLLATQLVAQIRQLFKVELPLRALFSSPTVQELAQVVKELQQENQPWQEQPILVRAPGAELPLSYAQTRLWFLDQFEPNSPFYNIPLTLHLEGKIDRTALETSLKTIIARHEILRTNFITVEEVATQVVKPEMCWELSVIDLQGRPDPQEVAQEIAQQDAVQPFNLAKDPLIRASLLVLSETEQIFLLCMHHIISDGKSVQILLQELTTLYNSYRQGEDRQLTPLSIQYGDFTLWQRDWLQGEILDQQLEYWQEKLADAPALLALPTDNPRPAIQGFAGAHHKFELSQELTEQLLKLTREGGVTLFMTLLAGFKTLLYRYTEQEDILVGTPIANRNHSDIEGLIGFFVNTLVLRTDLSGNPSFKELLGRVKETAMDAYAHQDLPFEMLVEALQPERDLSHSPLFQVDFLLNNGTVSQVELEGLSSSVLPTESTVAKYDLTLGMENRPTGLVGVWEYNTDLFEIATIERMTGHLITLLEGIVANPEQPIGELPLLTTVEQEQILKQWNNTETDYPRSQCVHHLFEEQVKRTPDALAVVFGEQSLTYEQLNIQANQLAHYLQSQGVGAEEYVGIYLERSLSIIVAILAILKAGGTYVPLDPDYPTQRLAYIAEDSQFKLLITQESLQDTLPTEGLTVISLDSPREIFTIQNSENPVSHRLLRRETTDTCGEPNRLCAVTVGQVSPKNLACILYTSGSTGKPKGVMLAHQALVNHSWAISEVFGLSSSDRVLQFASFSFDVAAEEIFPTWLTGGTVVLRPVQMFATMTDLADFIESEAISVVNITPAYWHEWAVAVSQGIATVPMCLRVAAVGGDAVIPETVTIWKKWVGERVKCLNVYGPTEASVTAIVHDLLDIEAETINSVLIGRPIPNTKAYILDANLQPVPIGARGELHLCGTRLARGYLNRPDLTAEKFIDNPFDPSLPPLNNSFDPPLPPLNKGGGEWSRLYKTGDVACYLPDGSIECFGRIDNQVKIRGFRIELGEIEAVLNQNSDIQASCVIIREDTPGDKYIVAYVVSHYERIPLISDLRQYLASQLPLYMVPQAFVFLEALPLTPNRKVDRRALPAPDLYSDRRDHYVAPRNPTEEILTQIWTQILKVEQVGIHDNFFEIGGHSLLATQLVSRIRSLFKVEMPLRSIFGAATVAELAQLITQLQQQELTSKIPEILPRTESTELVTSFAQTRLWFLDQLQPNSALYNIPLALRLEGKINQSALEASLRAINQRHEVLRTNFANIKGQPTPVINSGDNWQVAVVDWRSLSSVTQSESIQDFVKTQSQQPFDLANDELFRASLVLLSETEQILVICIHHIVSDGWSMEVLIQELTSLYSAYSQNQPANLAPLPIQYADFALWQKQWLQGEVLEKQLNYWQKQLADAPALLNLPTDRPRPPMQTFAGAYQEFTLDPETTQGLTALSKEEGVTLFMTLLAAFDVLLCRYTGETDILVGTPIANRNHSELEGLIGFFANTLVLRTNLAGNPSFKELLNQVRTMAMDAYAHQDLPFENLVEALQPERNLSHNPVFQVAFLLHNMPLSQVEVPSLVIEDLSLDNTLAKFDLTLALQNTDQGLRGVFEYNTDLFDASTIERMAGHFVTLLEGIVTNPQEQVGQLPLLTSVESQQLLLDWNQTQVEYPQHLCIHQLFEAQVLRSPDALAVVFEEQQLTYRELNQRANQLAHHLQGLGVKADDLVGICVDRTPIMVIGLLGILKAGGAYVPIDPDYPQERLNFILQDTQVKVLLTQTQIKASLPSHQAQVINLDQDWQNIQQNSLENPSSSLTTDNSAYVIYTSGSTGIPKGVVVPHGAVNRLVINTNYIDFTPGDRVIQASNIAFDAATFEIWGALLNGAKMVMLPKSVLLSPPEFAASLKENQISVLFLTTALFNQLVSIVPDVFSNLRYLLFGGEAVDPKWVQEALNQGAPEKLLHVYGPTENTTFSSWYLVTNCPDTAKTIPIGRGISNTQVYILDEYFQPVPVGVVGELHVGGAGLAKGYLNRPELTSEKFIPNPFSNEPHARLYKTGDLARYLPNGNVEYVGRIDHQVKLRGFRIELGEIEAVLSQHRDVQVVSIILREDSPGEKRLVAYIVPTPEVTPKIDELRQFLKAKLPDYMVPSAFVVLNALPLNSNGKIDRRSLPIPELQPGENWTAPRTEMEVKLAAIWSEVLKLEGIGIDDNFFDLGGHSLLATKVISRCQETFNISLPVRYIFDCPTIAELGIAIANQIKTGSELNLPPIVPVNRDGDIPLSWAQERLWFVHHLEGESAAYTIPFAIRLTGNLNIPALEEAINSLVQRHEPLRTHFEIKENQPVQIIAPKLHLALPVEDLQGLADVWSQVEKLATEESYKPFDLERGPILRVKLWQVTDSNYVLLFAIHHIAADGWSIGVLVSELSAYYRAIATETTVDLPDLAIQYADFAQWQRQWLTEEVRDRQLDYWKQQLAGVPPLLKLPTDRHRPKIQSFHGETEQLQLDPQLTQQIKKLSQESGSTLFMTLLGGFSILLSRLSGQKDIVVGSPIANRNRQETEDLIGFFVNSLALRFDLSQEPTFEELLAQVREVTQDAYDHQDLPFEMLVEELHPERKLDRNPLIQVVFALQNAPDSSWDLPELEVQSLPWEFFGAVRADLELHFWDLPEGLNGLCYYNTDLFDDTTIKRFLQHFQTLLTVIVASPRQPVSLLPLLTQTERQQIVTTWNDTSVDNLEYKCIHQLFEEQVERTPDGVAVVFEEQQLTYAELNRRANQLAHYLISLGVKPDTLVGICVERSPLMIMGLLGILKAGGAYVPIDPDYPQERLSFILEDTQVKLLLTQRSIEQELPQHQAQSIFLEDISEKIAPYPQENPQNGVTPSHLAYVIYTSGSTGKPKGVMVEHQGPYNLAIYQIEKHRLQPDSRFLQLASFSFDASIGGILMTLGSGASLYLGSKDTFMPGQPLVSQLENQGITHAILTPSALAVLPKQDLPDLKTIVVGGEACSLELIKQWSVGRNFYNGYGPTEASVCTAIAKCSPSDSKVTIGRPIANVQVHILDEHLQPLPIGVSGELHIGGIGVARGYLNRPELTEEKFIPNPFSTSPLIKGGRGDRLYKTGDLARYLADGTIELLGRIDNQVKVRGFRIETGEIEAVLHQHPLVQESVVVAREDIPGDKRLVAYLVFGINSQALSEEVEQWQRDYISDWQTIYEQGYSQAKVEVDDPTFDISGWISSYTRQPIPAGEMRVWVESTVSRILSLSPQRVLEIGCGSGLLLYRVAQHCQEYWGTDYSQSAVENVEQVCRTIVGLNNVQTRQQTAEDFKGIPPGKFDTIVLNSVIQYFPSVEYLLEVLEGAIANLGSDGTIFVGDVRSFPLLEPYHAAVQLYQAKEDTKVAQWQRQISQSIASEEELVVDPRFFFALQQSFPQITWVEIEPKRGYANNELTQFRYDVTLYLGQAVEVETVNWLNWQLDGLSLTDLKTRLGQSQPENLAIRRVPNQRLQEALTIWQWRKNPPTLETVAELREQLAQASPQGINPETLWELGASLGYTVHLSCWESSQDGCFDVVFSRNSSLSADNCLKVIPFKETQSVMSQPWTDYTNNPLQGKLVQKLVPQVREFCQDKLPNYMIPQAFVLLDALPLTPNGKVDRRALPATDAATRTGEIDFVSPQTPLEAQLVQIWSEVLGISNIGIKDNFFELGGHSLLATQVIYRLRDIFAVEISLQNFLEYPTIAGLSQMIEVLSLVKEPQISTTETPEDYEEGEL